MDIISAHQQGLIEQLDEEVAALSGQPRDHGQRAVVLHHLYDHSSGAYEWALAEARRNLMIMAGLERLQLRLRRWGWLGSGRDEGERALAELGGALGEASRRRCELAYRAYRLSATPALRGEAELQLPGALLEVLDETHRLRRSGEPVAEEVRQRLNEQSDLLAVASIDQRAVAAAWAAIDASGLKRAARRLVSDKALERAALRDRRRGWSKVELMLLGDPALPASFRTNPAQHFYALQHMLAERRRQRWREACDREPDAFELAA